MNVTSLADEIINGRRLRRGEELSFFFTADLDELCSGADRIRQHFAETMLTFAA